MVPLALRCINLNFEMGYIKMCGMWVISRFYIKSLLGLVFGKNEEETIMGSKKEENFEKLLKEEGNKSGKKLKEDEAQKLLKEK